MWRIGEEMPNLVLIVETEKFRNRSAVWNYRIKLNATQQDGGSENKLNLLPHPVYFLT